MKDGLVRQEHGPKMHGAGLKKKYRAYPPDDKGHATKGKK